MVGASKKFRYSLHLHLSTSFLVLIALVGLSIGAISYYQTGNIINKLTSETFARIAKEVVQNTSRLFSPAEAVVNLLVAQDLVNAKNREQRLEHLDLLIQALDESANIVTVYVGYDDGDFFLLRRLPDDATQRLRFVAPADTVYVVQSIDREDGATHGSYVYIAADHSILEKRDQPTYRNYDPRKRPWFEQAGATTDQIKTAPYIFFTTGEMGTTVARRSQRGTAVVAADITMNTLAQAMQDSKVTTETELALVSKTGELIAHPDPDLLLYSAGNGIWPVQIKLDQLESAVLSSTFADYISGGLEYHVTDRVSEGRTWRTMATTVALKDAESYVLVLAAPTDELLAEANEMLRNTMIALAIGLLIFIPISIYLSRLVVNPIKELVAETDAIRRFDFSDPITIKSFITEVDDLSDSMDGMKATIRQFLDISTAIASEEDFDLLQKLLLDETIATCRADAACIYLLDSDDSYLIPSVVRNQKRETIPITLARLPLSNPGHPIAEAIETGKPAQTQIDSESDAEDKTLGLWQLAQKIGEEDNELVAIPLFNRSHELVGVLVLFMEEILEDSYLSFVSALSGTAAVTIETRQLIETQKALFESFIRMIAGAIDAKSPYTGGHCNRVPQITRMLAQAAVDSTEGCFKDFTLSEEDWEAVHIASWLHDCGKVTTPEFVVDKATKLETIYDRIHEVRMRFEVMKRDVEIKYWQGLCAGKDQQELNRQMELSLAQLDDDFAFIASCNEGGEFLDKDKAERIRTVAAYKWRRTLDDRLGISLAEKKRMDAATTTPPTLPIEEDLLSDRPEHRFVRDEREKIAADNPWGFNIDVPALLYNRGELYNLLIERGTLTAEDRYKINEHMVQTTIMLSELPFPKHLRNVPEIACAHHEKMDGTGYPKRLSREQMSPVARMMAIADIFEALTAVDRPYKKGKTLTEALRIMSFMCKDSHIDTDLFELFLKSEVYLKYANKFMVPEQIDAVNIEDYLPKA